MDTHAPAHAFLCRPMRPDDLALCAAIEACVEDGWSESALSSELSQEIARLFVAETDGVIAALAVFQLVCGEASLCAVSTAPSMRRQGAAQHLLSAAFSALFAEGAQTVFLEVRSRNDAARALYRKLGFEEIGLRRNFYQNPCDDAILMKKSL